jgi:hypothetical protein
MVQDGPAMLSVSHAGAPGRRLLAGVFLAAWMLAWAGAGPASAATAARLTATGHVTGPLQAGSVLTVTLQVQHTGGWQKIQTVQVQLELRGQQLDEFTFDPVGLSVDIAGGGPAIPLGQIATIEGLYFSVNVASINISAHGKAIGLTVPLKLRAAPPTGARLTYSADGLEVPDLAPRALTPPVKGDSGFSWGTLGAAIAAALFAGSLIGGTFSSHRRAPQRPSVYAAVQRRIQEERTRR